MKRRVEETTKVDGVTPAILTQRTPHTAPNIVQTNYTSQGIKSEVPAVQQYQIQTNYATMPSITAIKTQSSSGLQGGTPHGGILVQSHIRHGKVGTTSGGGGGNLGGSSGGSGTPPTVSSTSSSGGAQFQRLKVEDALSYLDQVKYKFNSQPQVYNDFLEIMKEFKSQCIDTPGVIARVSQLFKGYPELISGFNTFLPPGYKIEVQANDTGYSLQVSVSNPLGLQTISEIPPLTPTQSQSVVVTNQQKPPSTVYSGVNSSINPSVGTPSAGVTIKGAVNDRISTSGGVLPLSVTPPTSTVQGAAVALTSVSNMPSLVLTPNASSVVTANHQASIISAVQLQQTSTNQPVEFNHAINYVNKIKNRFQGQPDKYKKFLEILHTYQKEQKTVKSGSTGGISIGGKHLTEAEVYSQVAQLFENHDDLLVEFGQFLPDATSHNSLSLASLGAKISERKGNLSSKYQGSNRSGQNVEGGRISSVGGSGEPLNNSKSSPQGNLCKMVSGRDGISNKRNVAELYNNERLTISRAMDSSLRPHSPALPHQGPLPQPPTKRQKNQSIGFPSSGENFEPIKRVIRNQSVYENFLRCLLLFNEEVISKSELLTLVTPMLAKHSEQLSWFKDLLGEIGNGGAPGSPPLPVSSSSHQTHPHHHQPHQPVHQPGPQHTGSTLPTPLPIPQIPSIHPSATSFEHRSVSHRGTDSRPDLLPTASTADIDFSSCKRIGASYCALPKSIPPPRCSGRSLLCKQVLNDTWVSFPTWSEDSTFVTSRKTQFEEYIYRCEDERFELDLVIECNAATIRVLDGIQKKMSRMSSEELSKFRLDDTLGGSSPTIHIRAIRRIYGDKAVDVVEGLKKSPSIVVPVVLRRLKAKEIEWRQAQKGFNKTWRDQNEKFYLKSLDHQGINFKQNDLKTLRSKSLYNEIEVIYDERNENGDGERTGPHLVLNYSDKSVLDDAANLLIHHVKRQTAIHKQDKTRIKQLLKHFLPDLFHHPRQDLSDDERDNDKMDVDPSTNKENNGTTVNSVCKSKESTSPTCNNNSEPVHELAPKNLPEPSSDMNSTEEMAIDIKQEPDDDEKDGLTKQKHDPHNHDESYSLFYGNNHWYLFVRLHQILCERLAKMSERSVKIAEEEAINSLNRRQSTAVALRLKPNEHCQDCYAVMLDMVKSVLDCSLDPQTYEDMLRNMFGIHAYIGFTLDRIVSYAVRQLQHLVSEENCVECTELHMRFSNKGSTGGLCSTANSRLGAEAAYYKAVSSCLAGDSCYKMYFYKKESKITLEMLDTEGDGEEEDNGGRAECSDVSRSKGSEGSVKWNEFSGREVSRHTGSMSVSDKADSGVSLNDREKWSKAVYLIRNLNQRKWRENKLDDKTIKGDSRGTDKCLGSSNNDKKVYVAIKESFLFKHGAMARARESHCRLSRRMFSRFSSWHSAWARLHVGREANEMCSKWFSGKALTDIHPCRTTQISHDPGNKRAPYRPYMQYTVQFFNQAESDRTPSPL
ncbi:paired amphipathic helix protein Sin3a [Cimex lectularius]|uniref:Paired amphipathic helix protein Sin3a n=1 Tax=Cimex lectularius TaxID=79782 RepID=A0A8I6TBB9_CIMLE|nr:paired amphipathic helix protein Sin3a [Cimex lectularius]XP_014240290.1 paired amphipathic helix protein Sin3a [Cimex lectularius]